MAVDLASTIWTGEPERYEPPTWASRLAVPASRIRLTHAPTPLHRWHLPGVPDEFEVWIKRDDLTGMETSGNKIRKLEFLLAAAKAAGADCIVTIGGIQSNFCRATAAAARGVGLDTYLILRCANDNEVNEAHSTWQTDSMLFGASFEYGAASEGNNLINHMVGAEIRLVSTATYRSQGSQKLIETLVQELKAAGRRPYPVAVGGSDPIGTWGYLELVRELEQQCRAANLSFTDIALSCGSGGSTAGVGLGIALSGMNTKVHAFGACDSPEWFHNYINEHILDGMGTKLRSTELVDIRHAAGAGYAKSTPEELEFIVKVSTTTGVTLDPVYTGKAAFHLVKSIQESPELYKGRKVLFVHTGGLFALYARRPELSAAFKASNTIKPLLPGPLFAKTAGFAPRVGTTMGFAALAVTAAVAFALTAKK